MPMLLPEELPQSLDDSDTLRWAVRSNGRSGFIFINNHQRVESLVTHPDAQFQLNLDDEILTVPQTPTVIPTGMYGIWPVNMPMDGAELAYATIQPITRLMHQGESTFIFGACDGIVPEFTFVSDSVKSIVPSLSEHSDLLSLRPGTNCAIRIKTVDDKTVQMLVLSADQALQLYQLTLLGKEYAILCSESIYSDGHQLHLQTRKHGEVSFAMFPAPEQQLVVDGIPLVAQPDGLFTRFVCDIPLQQVEITAERLRVAGQAQPVASSASKEWGAMAPPDMAFDQAEVWQVAVQTGSVDNLSEVYLAVSYVGDIGRAYIGDRLIDDDFYFGRTWEIGLKRFLGEMKNMPLTLKFLPLRSDAPVYVPPDRRPDFSEQDQVVHVGSIRSVVEFSVEITPMP